MNQASDYPLLWENSKKMSDTFDGPRVRSDSMSTTGSTSSRGILRQRLTQLLVCLEDLSSDDEANEEVSRTLDEAFYLCGKYTNRESFRCTESLKMSFEYTCFEVIEDVDFVGDLSASSLHSYL